MLIIESKVNILDVIKRKKGGHLWWPPFLKPESLFQDGQVTSSAPSLTHTCKPSRSLRKWNKYIMQLNPKLDSENFQAQSLSSAYFFRSLIVIKRKSTCLPNHLSAAFENREAPHGVRGVEHLEQPLLCRMINFAVAMEMPPILGS
jgi:hypothetical protein